MLVYILGVALFALGICVSVALHEAGHMVAAKSFGMKVRRYFVGFGPTVFSFRRGETEYGLKALPLGGFCDIAGMTALDEVTDDERPRAMYRFKTWKRTVVMAAGSFTHFLLGFIVLYLMAGFVVQICRTAVYGPQSAFFAELFSTRLRYSGASLSYQIASILGGGIAPMICTAVYGATQSSLAIAGYVVVLCAISFGSIYLLGETYKRDLTSERPAQRETTA